jgi:hypothetical protein
MENQIKIPDNFEIYKIENGTIYLKEKDAIPKNWEECVNTYGIKELEAINNLSIVTTIDIPIVSSRNHDILPKGLGYPMLALCQLLVCRNAYWKIDNNWKPDWSDSKTKYTIGRVEGKIKANVTNIDNSRILVFRTPEIRDTFYENFKDLIEQAKELL